MIGHAADRRGLSQRSTIVADHPQVNAGRRVYREVWRKCRRPGRGRSVVSSTSTSNWTICDHLQACDVYIHTYRQGQISAAPSVCLGGGGAVVSTPYLYAEESGRGPGPARAFGQSDAMADAALRFLGDAAFKWKPAQSLPLCETMSG